MVLLSRLPYEFIAWEKERAVLGGRSPIKRSLGTYEVKWIKSEKHINKMGRTILKRKGLIEDL